MFEKCSRGLTAALVVSLPFEFRGFPIASNLQWVLVLVLLVSSPLLVRNRHKLIHDRFVQLAVVFALVQWASAAMAGDHMVNSLKAAARITAGVTLFCIVWLQQDRMRLSRLWAWASIVAALYAVADYAGAGAPQMFREAEFYLGDQLRLSGSFEYPTTAAGYYAMSLPIVIMAPIALPVRIFGALLLWSVLILTYARGALIAAAAVLLIVWGYRNWKAAGKLALAGASLFAAISIFHPALITRFGSFRSGAAITAEYKLEFNTLHQRPRTADSLQVTVKNTGIQPWPSQGDSRVFLSYHWYNTAEKRILPIQPIETPLPDDVEAGEAMTLTPAFRTPDEPGLYLLDWDLKRQDRGWFSMEYEVTPAVVEVHVEEAAAVIRSNTDLTRWFAPGPDHVKTLDATVSRAELWSAAVALTRRSPIFGWGPDNFRLLYGPELGAGRWDTNIRANSLFFELLSGSGLLGLSAFVAMFFFFGWTAGAASMSVAVFLIHGIVDVLLMTTPIYAGFWMLLGLAHANRV